MGLKMTLLLALFLAQTAPVKPGNKVEIVSVTGCVREQGAGNWMVVAATDPVPSLANQAQGKEIPTTVPDGKNSFKLTGVGEFSMGSHRDKTVVVRGLFNKVTPVANINITSIVDALPTCIASAPK
jgi:hypothetical protein